MRKTICRACISKEEHGYMDEFYAMGIKVLYTYEVNGAYVVELPIEKVDEFVSFYLSVMQPGYWNEYLGPKTGFFAKMPTGETWHYEVTTENTSKINQKMQILVSSWDLNTDLWKWLAEVEIYRGWIKN